MCEHEPDGGYRRRGTHPELPKKIGEGEKPCILRSLLCTVVHFVPENQAEESRHSSAIWYLQVCYERLLESGGQHIHILYSSDLMVSSTNFNRGRPGILLLMAFAAQELRYLITTTANLELAQNLRPSTGRTFYY